MAMAELILKNLWAQQLIRIRYLPKKILKLLSLYSIRVAKEKSIFSNFWMRCLRIRNRMLNQWNTLRNGSKRMIHMVMNLSTLIKVSSAEKTFKNQSTNKVKEIDGNKFSLEFPKTKKATSASQNSKMQLFWWTT